MAKWGEGDARWIVDERKDGKNVGSWHWEDVSKLKWSKERLGELLTGLDSGIDASRGSLCLTGVRSITGEASITTRKGNKRFAMFDLVITADYEGQTSSSDKKVKGTIKLEDFTSHSDEDEYIFSATVDGSGSEQDECKRIAEGMKDKVVEQLRKFVEEINSL